MASRAHQKQICHTPIRRLGAVCLAVGLTVSLAGAAFGGDGEPDSTPLPRQLYNEGTHRLKDGKLREAESFLQSAVASQDPKVQPRALYNLAHVRFQQGQQELTNAPDGRAAGAASDRAAGSGNDAISAIDAALAQENLDSMIAAYLRGRGARKDLKAATEAVQRALDTYGAVLAKWRRASGDFKSAGELRPTDTDAQTNAALVDRRIAALVDKQQPMSRSLANMKATKGALAKKMAELKAKMPAQALEQMKDKNGDEENDDDDNGKTPQDLKEGQQEGSPKNGQEMRLTPEAAQRLLGMLKLDANRKLFLGGFEETAKPKDRKVRDW